MMAAWIISFFRYDCQKAKGVSVVFTHTPFWIPCSSGKRSSLCRYPFSVLASLDEWTSSVGAKLEFSDLGFTNKLSGTQTEAIQLLPNSGTSGSMMLA